MYELTFVSKFNKVGFSGSRHLLPCSELALRRVVKFLDSNAQVFTGCATGADELARFLFPSSVVFKAKKYGSNRGAFVARSIACVQAVGSSGLWVAFPSSCCPVGLMPSAKSSHCFNGSGSGTWASLALAIGLGLTCLVFFPPAVSVPAGWPLVSIGGGWFVFRPCVSQLSLF